MDNLISNITQPIVGYAVTRIKNQLSYLIHYNHNMKDLKEKVENLMEFREGLQHRVDEAKRNVEGIEVEVQSWLSKVDAIIEESKQFQKNDEEAKKKCFNQSCLNLVQRHQFSRRAKKMVDGVLQVKEQGKFERVSYRIDPQQFKSSIDMKRNYVNFESRNSTKENIIKVLKESNVDRIGVYGMGGVGKTELVKEITRRVKETKLFDKVVMATITQEPDVTKVQGEIGEMLRLEFKEESTQGRASKLHKRLQDEKSILLVLDDMWESLDLETVGIPCEGECKILITSRDKHVLFNEMDVKVNFELNSLDGEESWDFFKRMLDVAIEENYDLELIAHQVASECGGLPIALVTVAKALRGKPLATWKDALDQLKNSNVVNIKGMNEKVYSSLELSYKFLEHDETKNLFLLCSMYPEDYDIGIEDDLLKYVMGMRFLDVGLDTVTKVRNRIANLTDDLRSSCLLLESAKGSKYVKMHDVVRDVGRSIASKCEKMLTIRNNNVVFLRCANSDNLSYKLKFSEIELLVLSQNFNGEDLQVPETFFNEMAKLKVLEFERMMISTLPSSLCSLKNLRTLNLSRCGGLENVDLIGELKRLEILSFKNSYIKELPLAISQLTQLKVLDLRYCEALKVISPNIISRLTNLEELDMKKGFCRWEGKILNNGKKNASLSELKWLPHLTALRACIPYGNTLSEQMFSNELELERFEITIGLLQYDDQLFRRVTHRVLKLGLYSRIVFNNDLKKLVNWAEEMVLEGQIGETDVLSKFDGFHPRLKHLNIYENKDIVHLISEANLHLLQAWSALESLHLFKMMSLESVVWGHIPKTVCFKKLRSIQMGCHKMRNLFVFSIMKCLSNLQSLKVTYCQMVEGIVAMENHEEMTSKIEFHQLKSLILENLPQYTSFCLEPKRGRQLLLNDSQQCDIIEEDAIGNFKLLFNEQVEFANLEELAIDGLNNLKMIWDDRLIAHSLSKLKEISITSCRSVSKVFFSNVVRAFKALEQVQIEDCDLLEEIFEINDPINPTENYDDMIEIPLTTLYLSQLSSLKHVWSKDPQRIFLTFQKLQHIAIKGCLELKSLFPISFTHYLQQLKALSITKSGLENIFDREEKRGLVSHKAAFPSLEVVIIDDADNLKTIWDDELTVDSFCSLQVIQIRGCKSLKRIFRSNMMRAIGALERLDISDCESLEEIFEIDEVKGMEIRTDVLNAKLSILKLSDLPNLRHVWSKDPQEFLLYQNLQEVEVLECPKLTRLFPASFANYLPRQLESLTIKHHALKEIFEKKNTLSFSNLLMLRLQCEEKLFGQGKSPMKLFPRLKILELTGFCCYRRTHLPGLDQMSPKLEKIEVENIFLMEIFSGTSGNQNSTPLKELSLIFLPKLMHIWNGGSEMSPSFENLEILQVETCGALNVIIPSPLSLQNLKTLRIIRCHGLTSLLSCSVAKGLVQLEEMHVEDCKRMTTIIGEGDSEEAKEIVFSKLKEVKLHSLPRVKAFHLGKCTIIFSRLDSISIGQCLEMKTFSLGMIRTLESGYITMVTSEKYSLSHERFSYSCDINTIIKNYWEDDNICQNLFQEEIHKASAQGSFKELLPITPTNSSAWDFFFSASETSGCIRLDEIDCDDGP